MAAAETASEMLEFYSVIMQVKDRINLMTYTVTKSSHLNLYIYHNIPVKYYFNFKA